MSSLQEKLGAIEERYEAITADLGKPEVVSDPAEYQKRAKTRSELEPLVELYRRLKSAEHQLSETEIHAERDGRKGVASVGRGRNRGLRRGTGKTH